VKCAAAHKRIYFISLSASAENFTIHKVDYFTFAIGKYFTKIKALQWFASFCFSRIQLWRLHLSGLVNFLFCVYNTYIRKLLTGGIRL